MSSSTVEITCPRCKQAWYVDIAGLDEPDQVLYRRGQTRRLEYRLRCPQCGTYAVVEVEIDEEAGDG